MDRYGENLLVQGGAADRATPSDWARDPASVRYSLSQDTAAFAASTHGQNTKPTAGATDRSSSCTARSTARSGRRRASPAASPTTSPGAPSPEPLDTGRSYARSRTRAERDARRGSRSSCSLSGSGSGGSRSDEQAPTRYPAWVMTRDTTEPKHKTVAELMDSHRRNNKPHESFDIDGDGAVGQTDLKMASRFKTNAAARSSTSLREEEIIDVRKQMVSDQVAKFRRQPPVLGADTEKFVIYFQQNMDELCRSGRFRQHYAKLEKLTHLNNTNDSTNMEGALHPEVVGQRHQSIQAFLHLDADGDGVLSADELRATLEEQVSDGLLDQDTMTKFSRTLDGSKIRLKPPVGSNKTRGEKLGMSFKDFASKAQESGAIRELAAAVAVNKPMRRPWSRSVVVPPPPFDSGPNVTENRAATASPNRPQYRTHSEMMQARQANDRRFAMKKLQDLPERYKRSHLQLPPQLVFFAKEF